MTPSLKGSQNYCAIVVALSKFVDLPKCDNIKGAIILGNQVLIGKDAKEGDVGIYFPIESQLSIDFLSQNNLYRSNRGNNVDPLKSGFFEEHGRVKAVKLRGHKSEGFFIPINSLTYLSSSHFEGLVEVCQIPVGTEFDHINDQEICRKYIPKRNVAGERVQGKARVSRETLIVEDQLRFHTDTYQLRKNIHAIYPNTVISVTDKWHGTSAVVGNLLTKRTLNWVDKLAKWLGITVVEQEYALVWTSRRVVKGVGQELDGKQHFYKVDTWGELAKEIGPSLPKGYTVYGEITGYSGQKPIQAFGDKPYAYWSSPGNFQFHVYRVTNTNPDGKVIELSWPQVKVFCLKYGLLYVAELYYGPAGLLTEDWIDVKLETIEQWQERFLKGLEAKWVHDQDCEHNPGLPAEGIVVRIDHFDKAEVYKLKNYRFLEQESKQLDKGEVDIETSESEEVEVAA